LATWCGNEVWPRGTGHFCFGDNSRYGGANASDWHGGTVVVRAPAFRRA